MFDRDPDTARRPSGADITPGGPDGKIRRPPSSDLLDVWSIGIEPFTPSEVRGLRRLGRDPRPFDGLARKIVRCQFLRAFAPFADDPEAREGLRRKERMLLLEAFAAGHGGTDELRMRAMLSRCAPDEGDNLLAMLAVALEFDCMRLGMPVVDDGEPMAVS